VLTDKKILQYEDRKEIVQKEEPKGQAVVTLDLKHDYLPIFA
jgi:hypothetical protein